MVSISQPQSRKGNKRLAGHTKWNLTKEEGVYPMPSTNDKALKRCRVGVVGRVGVEPTAR
jgi:hypothetical protein